MWYSDLFRRHLCDMHIEDWSDEFLSEFSPENYVSDLQAADVNYAMIYFQSHVGLCYWPTESGVMHKAFKSDPEKMKRLVDLCHLNGIKVMGYYSINYNTREHDRHPEWRQLAANGRSARENRCENAKLDFASAAGGRYGLCCPNSDGYRQFVLKQVDEMLDFFKPDGMFFDMPFWTSTCYCNSCKKRYAAEIGGDIPQNAAPDSRENTLLMTAKHRWMGEFVMMITDHIKSGYPEMPVEFNYAMAIAGNSDNGCGEYVAKASDFTGGDLYGDLFNQSITCKFMRAESKNQPFEYMFSRCKPNLRSHTLTKTTDQMKTALAVTMAHHGATLVIDAIDPVGTLDERVYRRFGEVFRFQKPYEKYFTGDPVCDVGVYYGLRSKNDRHGEKMNAKTAAIGAIRSLIKNNILCDVVGMQSPDKFKCIVAPMLTDAEPDSHALIDYVRAGNTVYLSGVEDIELFKTLTKGKYLGRTEENKVYIAPTKENEDLFLGFNNKYPLMWDGTAAVVKASPDTEILAYIKLPYTKPNDTDFASIHSNPPGKDTDIPAVTVNRFGKGTVIWSAVPIEAGEAEEYGKIFTDLLINKGGVSPMLISDAPDCTELTAFLNCDGSYTVNCTVLDGAAVPRPVDGFEIKLRTDKAPKRVVLIPDETPVDFTYCDGFVKFNTRKLKIFDMYKIEC